MSLDRAKLQKVRDLGNGGWQAQCPACSEAGQDSTGEHLRISPEGKFGCCVFPGDREHRRRIFALAGDYGQKAIRVKVASAKVASAGQLDRLGRLGRVFGNPAKAEEIIADNSGTLGTGFQDPRAYADEPVNNDLFIRKLIGSEEPVPSVPTVEHGQQLETGVPSVPKKLSLPRLLSDGTLVIPFNSPERYHWWKRGQSVKETLAEVRERMKEEENGTPF